MSMSEVLQYACPLHSRGRFKAHGCYVFHTRYCSCNTKVCSNWLYLSSRFSLDAIVDILCCLYCASCQHSLSWFKESLLIGFHQCSVCAASQLNQYQSLVFWAFAHDDIKGAYCSCEKNKIKHLQIKIGYFNYSSEL